LLGNLLIAILKLVAGLLANSAALLAEAAHSFSDVGNQVLLLIGISRSKRPPTEANPFGGGKAAYFWPFLVAVLLFGVAGAYSLIEGIRKTLHPHELEDIRLGLAVLAVSFGIEIVSLSVAARQARKDARARGIHSLREFLVENRDATILTVLVEDSLALVGLPMAAIALLLAEYTGNPVWDGIGSLVIGALLMGFAFFLGFEVKDLLIGKGLSPRDCRTVKHIFDKDPAVKELLMFRSMYVGPHAALLGAEFSLRESVRGPDVAPALLRVEGALREALPVLRFVYLEPSGVADSGLTEAEKSTPPERGLDR
ncbi:MAG TPA: cation diffusion facilitator family transporter, partial [Candidatus Thermoplasmatota archaeon]|nr:cation diffusion facilitator family transporter [Candidatus Thermoplasmatota archaeon]